MGMCDNPISLGNFIILGKNKKQWWNHVRRGDKLLVFKNYKFFTFIKSK